MVNITHCPVCQSGNFSPYLICKDHTVTQEEFKIVSCSKCGFKFTNPIPAISDLGKYYKSEDYISHSNTRKGIVSRLYHLVRAYTLRQKENILLRYVSRGTLLDYGCGTGMFLKSCRESGWKVRGVEPDEGARKIAADQGSSIYESLAALKEAMPEERYDAISLWHVLEHVPDLRETISFFKTNLKPGGVLAVAVPNYTSFDARHYGAHWAAYDVPRHLYHFDPPAITGLMEQLGFKLHKTLPMRFDSFYVSMLSEKYKTGKLNLIKAFGVGLWSNLKATKAQSCSSVIYLFKHA